MSAIFSKRLAYLRKLNGVTQTELAKAVGKPRSTISGYESDGKEPDYNSLCQFANYFGVTVDYLVGNSEEQKPIEVVYFSDNIGFQSHYKNLPANVKPVVRKAFDNFYNLLDHDVVTVRSDRLELYQELLETIRTMRKSVSEQIESSGGQIDAAALSALMSQQNELKASVSSVLDELMQADMNISHESVLSARVGSSVKQAM